MIACAQHALSGIEVVEMLATIFGMTGIITGLGLALDRWLK